MTKRSEHEWLADIISWGERLQRHVDGIDRTTFLGSEIIQDARGIAFGILVPAWRILAFLTKWILTGHG
jgi:uncharacterized protein with HEPN domain